MPIMMSDWEQISPAIFLATLGTRF